MVHTRFRQNPWRLITTFRAVILVVLVAVGVFLHLYTRRIIEGLRTETRSLVSFYAGMYAQVAETESSSDLNFLFDEVILRTDFPLINTDVEKRPIWWKGISVDSGDHSGQAVMQVQKMVDRLDREIKPVPITFHDTVLGYLYYGDSRLIQQLYWLPYIEIGILGLFVLVGFIGFANLQQSEQRFIWVGMAKETAHQLGTPLSSLLGWLEILRGPQKRNRGDIYREMEQDLSRLKQVSQRFSQIGSRPSLEKTDISQTLSNVCDYIQARAPRMGRTTRIVQEFEKVPQVMLNPGLFQWAVENIMKNSLDAMDKPEGLIRLRLFSVPEKRMIFLEIEDNGRGMDPRQRKKIFKPGYSSKERGWGLGLNLARRIIEEYHGGRLYLKSAKPGVGVVFCLELKAQAG